MNYLPNKLTTLRKHYNYSQAYVADYLDIDAMDYMQYENGSKMIDYSQVKRLAALYHIPVMELFLNNETVTLHAVNATTDEINIEYFEKELSTKEKVLGYCKEHKLVTGIILGLIITIIVLIIFVMNLSKGYTPILDDGNRLSASDTTVIYIDEDGRVLGSGSNTNGELSNLSYDQAIKVAEGQGFTVILNDDGTLDTSGLTDDMAAEVSNWKDLIDLAAGDSHIIAVNSDGYVYCTGNDSACELTGNQNAKRVFAVADGSILEDGNGYLTECGTFVGSSSIKDYSNIIAIDDSSTVTALVDDKNKIHVYSNNGENYFMAESWDDIVDVACGDDFVAGLDKYGKVHIEITNDDIELEVSNWSNMIAIAAGKDYLVGFDGNKIVGVGKNTYHQFSQDNQTKQTLEMVSNVSYQIKDDQIFVQFDGVNNASAYKVSINVLTGLSKRVESASEIVSFETTNMIEGKMYTISIVSIGSGDYKDSDTYTLDFTYEIPVVEETETEEADETEVEE